MSDFKAKMYQIQFWMGLRSKGRGREGEERGPHPFPPNPYFWIRPWIAQDRMTIVNMERQYEIVCDLSNAVAFPMT